MNGTDVSNPTPVITAQVPPLRVDEQNVIWVGNTRVTLDTLVADSQRGDTPEEIARNCDALSLGEVCQALGYYLAHQTEVDTYLEQRHASRAAIRKQVESCHKPTGIRARLLARRQPQG